MSDMKTWTVADLNEDLKEKIKQVEQELGVALVAYEELRQGREEENKES